MNSYESSGCNITRVDRSFPKQSCTKCVEVNEDVSAAEVSLKLDSDVGDLPTNGGQWS